MEELDLDIEQLISILELLEGRDFTEFRFEGRELKIVIRRDPSGHALPEPGPLSRVVDITHPVPTPVPDSLAPVAEEEPRDGTVAVTAPMVGTVYRAPQPGSRPFVEVGDRVNPDSIVCVIEVMKLMHSVPAGVAGIVTEIRVANGASVEYGQVLLKLQPELAA